MRIIELSNGVKMPIIGFGTIGQFGKQVEDNVSFALQDVYKRQEPCIAMLQHGLIL